jgi:two-component system, OmpR family, sensor histidine kinase BaeS
MRYPPPWWPANEAWPPVRGSRRWRAHRARFLQRALVGLSFLLFLVTLGAQQLLSWIFGGFPLPSRMPPIAGAFAVAIVIFGFVSFAMRRFGLPMGDIVGAANRVAEGDYSVRLSEHGPPSIRTVAHAFNSMTTRLEKQEQQRRHLMADIAHELRTPLTVIQGRLEGLIDGVYPRDEDRLVELLNDTRMLARLVDDLQTLANAESGTLALHKEPTDVGILLQDIVRTFSDEARTREVDIDVQSAKDLPLMDIDPLRVREVLTNLVANAVHHTPGGGRVSLTAVVRSNELVIGVADSGSGIDAAELPKIFDRFYKGLGSRGSGLGLTISKNLVEAHGGTIRAASQPGRGTTITFTLPISLGHSIFHNRSARL